MELLGLRGLRTGGAGLSQGVAGSSLELQGGGGRVGPELAAQTIGWLYKLSRSQTPTNVSYILGIYFAADMLQLCG